MTYRLTRSEASEALHLELQGTLDAAAVESLRAIALPRRAACLATTVTLAEGTEVDAESLASLLRVEGLTVAARSPYLQRWISTTLQPPEKKDEP